MDKKQIAKTTREAKEKFQSKKQAKKFMREAEVKFLSNDIKGAKRIVLRAEKLFPSLPGLPQMLAAFNVHLAAASKDANWYAILDVDPSDDIQTIKKQYKKLTLLTHPDKNHSSAAEGAFKLVVQAWEAISCKPSCSERGSKTRRGSCSDSGADDKHGSTSGATSSSRPYSAQSDPKTTGASSARSGSKTACSSSTRWVPKKSSSNAKVACPKCSRDCKSLDCNGLIIRCSYCNLFAVRGRQDSSIYLTIDEQGPGILGL